MPSVRRLGADAEDRAADYLLEKGFTIVTRRFKARRGEIDLVVLDGDVLVFVEVKERSRGGSLAESSVSAMKAKRLAMAADQYVRANGELEREVRFDLVCFDPEGVRHHVDAFRPAFEE
jgi:putative endonuclease